MIRQEALPIKLSLVFNILSIAVKTFVFGASGSRSVFAEIFHSIGDLANSSILYLGSRIASQTPSVKYPFGLGRVVYIAGLLSSILLSGSIVYMIVFESLRTLAQPHTVTGNQYWILILSLTLLDATTLAISIKRIRRIGASRSVLLKPLILEDLMGISGNVLAAAALATGNAVLDVYFALVIATIILASAIHVGYSNIQILIGRSVPRDVIGRIVKIALSMPYIVDVNDVKSMIIDPNEYLVIIQVEIDRDVSLNEIENIKNEFIEIVRRSIPEVKYMILDIVKPREPEKSYERLLREIKRLD